VSYTEVHSGKLKRVTNRENAEKFLQRIVEERGGLSELTLTKQTAVEYISENYGDFVIIGDNLFEILDASLPDDDDTSLCWASGEDEIDYLVKFYNGGCGLLEALADLEKENPKPFREIEGIAELRGKGLQLYLLTFESEVADDFVGPYTIQGNSIISAKVWEEFTEELKEQVFPIEHHHPGEGGVVEYTSESAVLACYSVKTITTEEALTLRKFKLDWSGDIGPFENI
jgi:hypothetical protein